MRVVGFHWRPNTLVYNVKFLKENVQFYVIFCYATISFTREFYFKIN